LSFLTCDWYKGLKLFLAFRAPVLDFDLVNGQYTGYYIAARRNPPPDAPFMLASLVMGKQAERYYEDPDRALANYLAELDRFSQGAASKQFIGHLAFDWGAQPYIQGVYSYTQPGGTQARKRLRQPLANKVFFAGEAMNTAHDYACVHGAIDAADVAFAEIAALYRKRG
jgi:monoamine oxidase